MIESRPVRIAAGLWRLGVLIALLMVSLVHSLFLRKPDLRARCQWRAAWCRRIVRGIGLRVEVKGLTPAQGLIVSNHITYLDVLVLGALIEGVFIAKKEVRSWPLIGRLTAFGGSIYVDRQSVRSAAEVNRAIGETLDGGLPVVLFPEGTSSIGETVLPFHPTLFQAASHRQTDIWPGAIGYGVLQETVAYCDDRAFGSHIVQTLRLKNLRAEVAFADRPIPGSERRNDAAASFQQVSRLHTLAMHREEAAPDVCVAQTEAV